MPARWLLVLLPAPVLAAQVPDQPSKPPERVLQLTLEDALRIAMRNNLDLEIERLSTEEARHLALGSWGAFDPVLAATGTASEAERQGTSSLAGGTVVEDDDLQLDVGLSQPLTTGGRLDLTLNHVNSKTTNQFAAFDVSTTDVLSLALTQPLLRGGWRRYATADQTESEVLLQRQIETERETLQRVLLDVTNAYWDLVSAEEELAVRQIAVDLGLEQLAQDRRRLEVGAGTEVDVLQAETNAAQNEQQRLLAEFDVRQSRDSLRRLLSPRPEGEYEQFLAAWDWPIETLTALPEIDSTLQLSWTDSLQLAIEQRPELAQRRLDVRLAEVDLTRRESERLPQLDLALATSSVGFDADPQESLQIALDRDFPSSSAALIFSFPLFNRTARHAERAARAALRSARLAYDRLELDVLADVRASVRDVLFGVESVEAAGKSRDLARRQLEAEQTRQEVGLSTTFQVLQFQEDLARALSTEVAAKAVYAKSLAKLAHAEGRLGADIGVDTTAPAAAPEPQQQPTEQPPAEPPKEGEEPR